MLTELVEKEKSKIWALIVFFAPITTPYYIYRVKKEEGITWIMLFLATFSAVIAGEVALYNYKYEKLKYSDKSPVIRQTLKTVDELKKTTKIFDASIIELEEMSRLLSGLDKIGETIDFIGEVRVAGAKNKATVSQIKNYIENYRGYFSQKDIEWVFQIEEYYKNDAVTMHLKSLDSYLNAFENLLLFAYKNFYNIAESEDPKALKNYDAYYLQYRRASEKFSKFNMRRNKYQAQFVQQHPKAKPYLPGVRQTEVFNVNRKSSINFF